jgi:hypothetical protein
VTANGNGNDPELMTPGEVAALFRVDPRRSPNGRGGGNCPVSAPSAATAGTRPLKSAPYSPPLRSQEQAAHEPDLDDVANEYPRWHCRQGASGTLYAGLAHSSPPVLLKASDPAGLREKIRSAEAGLP